MRELRLGIFALVSFMFLHLPQVRGSYFLIDLDSQRPYSQSVAYAINNNGLVVGKADNCGFSRAAMFNSATQTVTNLGSPEGYTSTAWDVNDQGIIVGEEEYRNENRAIRFDADDPTNNKNLGGLTGKISQAFGINNHNVIVGQANQMDNSTQYLATRFDFNDQSKNTPLSDGVADKAEAINDSGQSVGDTTMASSGQRHATLFSTEKKDLGILPGGNFSTACDINTLGEIVGSGNNASGTRAIRFDSSGQGDNTDLGTLGGSASMAFAINDLCKIVGMASDVNGNFHATLFDPHGNIDLNSMIENRGDFLGYNLVCAMDINNKNEIVGYMTTPNDTCHAFLLVHAPEPSSLLTLIGMGVPFSHFIRRKL